MISGNKKRISDLTALAMISIAIIFDVVGFVFVLTGLGIVFNVFLAIVAWPIYIIWFYINGVKLIDFNGKKSVRKFGVWFSGVVIEMIPVLGILPGFSISISSMIILTRAEDRTGMSSDKVISIKNRGRLKNRESQFVEKRRSETKEFKTAT